MAGMQKFTTSDSGRFEISRQYRQKDNKPNSHAIDLLENLYSVVTLCQNEKSNINNKKHKYIVLKPTISKPNIGHGVRILTILKMYLFGAMWNINP
jgi:hypothetical protein